MQKNSNYDPSLTYIFDDCSKYLWVLQFHKVSNRWNSFRTFDKKNCSPACCKLYLILYKHACVSTFNINYMLNMLNNIIQMRLCVVVRFSFIGSMYRSVMYIVFRYIVHCWCLTGRTKLKYTKTLTRETKYYTYLILYTYICVCVCIDRCWGDNYFASKHSVVAQTMYIKNYIGRICSSK